MDIRKGHFSLRPLQHLAQILKIIFLGSLVFAAVFTFNRYDLSKLFLIKTVRVYGGPHLNHEEVQRLLLPLIHEGFFMVNVDNIRDRLLPLPWVADIFVRRDWPDQIEINIIEKQAIAYWNRESLLSETGELFAPARDTYPLHLPLFVGPSGQQAVMLTYFNDMNRLLAPLHVKISYLELTPYLTWKLALDNGMRLQMGHKEVLNRLGDFVKVYPKIFRDRDAAHADSIDLRYPNGLAIRWKTAMNT